MSTYLERYSCRSNRLTQLWTLPFSTSALPDKQYMTHIYWSFFTANRIKSPDKLRLAMLYALRYEDTGNLRAVKSRLLESGLTPEKVDLIDALLQYSGVRRTSLIHNTWYLFFVARFAKLRGHDHRQLQPYIIPSASYFIFDN